AVQSSQRNTVAIDLQIRRAGRARTETDNLRCRRVECACIADLYNAIVNLQSTCESIGIGQQQRTGSRLLQQAGSADSARISQRRAAVNAQSAAAGVERYRSGRCKTQ